eukprot:1094926-Pelagomonas_calceolata.AAC.2
MELVIRDNCLGVREHGGTHVEMQFMKQLSSRRLMERPAEHHNHMALEPAKVLIICNVTTLEFNENALEAKLQLFEDEDALISLLDHKEPSVRAAPDAPFFSRVRFTRAALRDHRCRTHRAGLLSALAQHSQKQSF